MKTHSNKKGAIELSMTTIIVVVLGITLLTLGLTFIKNIFLDTGDISDTAFGEADRMVREMMASNEAFYISTVSVDLKPGKTKIIGIGVRDYDHDTNGDAKLFVSTASELCDLPWLTYNEEFQPTNAGDLTSLALQIKIPKTTQTELTCFYTITAKSSTGFPYGTGTIIVNTI